MIPVIKDMMRSQVALRQQRVHDRGGSPSRFTGLIGYQPSRTASDTLLAAVDRDDPRILRVTGASSLVRPPHVARSADLERGRDPPRRQRVRHHGDQDRSAVAGRRINRISAQSSPPSRRTTSPSLAMIPGSCRLLLPRTPPRQHFEARSEDLDTRRVISKARTTAPRLGSRYVISTRGVHGSRRRGQRDVPGG
jgi:hypothetical protein